MLLLKQVAYTGFPTDYLSGLLDGSTVVVTWCWGQRSMVVRFKTMSYAVQTVDTLSFLFTH